jgi:hypothetical protein
LQVTDDHFAQAKGRCRIRCTGGAKSGAAHIRRGLPPLDRIVATPCSGGE